MYSPYAKCSFCCYKAEMREIQVSPIPLISSPFSEDGDDDEDDDDDIWS